MVVSIILYPIVYTCSVNALLRHLLTGLGAYCYIVWGTWLRHCLNRRQDEYEFVWPRLYHLPEVVRVQDPPATNDSLQNGFPKKSQ